MMEFKDSKGRGKQTSLVFIRLITGRIISSIFRRSHFNLLPMNLTEMDKRQTVQDFEGFTLAVVPIVA